MSQYKIVLRQKGKALGRGAGARRWACAGVGAQAGARRPAGWARRLAGWGEQGERAGARRAARSRARAGAQALAGARVRADSQAGVAHPTGGRWVGVGGRQRSAGREAAGRRRRRAAAERGARAAGRWVRDRALGAQLWRAGWPRAVHSVHLACFWLVLTRYFS